MRIWGLTQEAAAGSGCPFAGDVLYVRCSFQGRLHPFRSAADESKKSTFRVFTALILLKATMRFEEGYPHLRRWHSTPRANLYPSCQD
jgi:hypothetical protein